MSEEKKNKKPSNSVGTQEARNKKQKGDLQNCEELCKEIEAKYKRALADYHNLAKQTAEEKAGLVKYANEQLILEMLPVYDNLKTSINFSDQSVQGNGWAEGIKYVIKQFREVLENNGVKEIKTEGSKFDHNKMEAVEQEETDDELKDEVVARELKPGYEMNGKIVHPARVAVYKYKK